MKKLNLNENFISRIWRDKLYYSDLKTTDGKPIKVLDYGILNKDSGADYKNARVKIEDKIFAGDLEIHRSLRDWEQHSHGTDGKYNKVILQVVFWDDDFPGGSSLPVVMKSREVPTVVLSRFLTKSIHEIWREIINSPSSEFRLACYPENRKVNAGIKSNLLNEISLKRLRYRTGRLRQRLEKLAEAGFSESKKKIWEKLFFEFTLEALGFSKNKEQFLKFAMNTDLNRIKKLNMKTEEIESLFYGAAGLLDDIKYKDDYTERLNDNWKKIKDKYKPAIMNEAEWNFFRLRPQNFPTIRMAYASSFCGELLYNNFLRRVILCFEKSKNVKKDLMNLFLGIRFSDYWKKHYIFGREVSKSMKSIGDDRISDIIINVVIPLMYLYSEKFDRKNLTEKITDYYSTVKEKSENEITRIMQEQLDYRAKTISEKQGLIHLYNFYCVKVKCDNCPIGKQVFGEAGSSDILKIILY